MKMSKSLSLLVALAFGVVAASSQACDKSKPCSSKKTAMTVADKTVKDGRSESAHAKDSPCGKGCTTPCTKCPHAKKSHASGHAKDHSGCSEARKVDAVLASLPTMQYRIGDKSTSCSKQAKALAEANGGSMQYVVGDASFSSADEASTKLVSLIEEEIKNLQAVQYSVDGEFMRCPMTAKKVAARKNKTMVYRVGGFDFADKEKAETVAKLVKDAAETVKLSYQVGDQSFCCDRMAGAKAKETGKPMMYRVGDELASGSIEAKRLLAVAKVRAIVETAKAQVGS